MRLFCALVLAVLVCASLSGVDQAAAFGRLSAPADDAMAHDVLFKCGTVNGEFTCGRSFDAVKPKKGRIPGKTTDPAQSPEGGIWQGDVQQDALPPASGDTGYSQPPASAAVPSSCPENSELLGGHCIPFTQRCTAGIPPTAYPPQCQGEEKQVCSFHPDGSKDCCCRVYSKF